ncbi:hypothetical protein HQ533_04315 [Candidatus Woesearchaeota archaeon]|nr:hypothetical protein [Candidatus Woesearchaeota archaeon]
MAEGELEQRIEQIREGIKEQKSREENQFYEVIQAIKKNDDFTTPGEEYDRLEKRLENIEFAITDIHKFIEELKEEKTYNQIFNFEKRAPLSKHEYMGLVISALINSSISDKDTVSLNTEDLPIPAKIDYEEDRNFQDIPVPYLGFRHSKGTLVINGEVESVGEDMKSGNVKINGRAVTIGKDMRGGNIIIKGQTTGAVGENMRDGLIEITGNHKEYHSKYLTVDDELKSNSIGCDMEGGSIIINGSANLEIISADGNGYSSLYYSRCGLIGAHMKGGIIKITRNVSKADIGEKMTAGEIDIRGYFDGRCSSAIKGSVGTNMDGGRIKILGGIENTFSVGTNMRNGTIHFLETCNNRIGDGMEGGNIIIDQGRLYNKIWRRKRVSELSTIFFGISSSYKIVKDHFMLPPNIKGGTIRVGGKQLFPSTKYMMLKMSGRLYDDENYSTYQY